MATPRLPARLLLSRTGAGASLVPRGTPPHPARTTVRPASTANGSKQRVLEKPARFNPPSHPARLPRRQRPSYPGPPLSDREKAAQKTKQYPHMMPPEGSFLRWFLTNRTIHVWITMSILCSLAFFTWLTNFLTSTPYRDQLPPNSMFLSHPFAFLGRYYEVYRLHTQYVSVQTADHRKQKVEDVRKRAEYRKAHGIEQDGLFGGWDAKADGEVMGPGLRESGDKGKPGQSSAGDVEKDAPEKGSVADGAEGRRKPVRKWLGIW